MNKIMKFNFKIFIVIILLLSVCCYLNDGIIFKTTGVFDGSSKYFEQFNSREIEDKLLNSDKSVTKISSVSTYSMEKDSKFHIIPNPRYSRYNNIGSIDTVEKINENENLNWHGTGFVVGKHTIITNKHVIEDDNYNIMKLKDITFTLGISEYDNENNDLVLNIDAVRLVPDLDIAVIRVKEDLSYVTTPLPLSNNTYVNGLNEGDSITMVGYPSYKKSTNNMYKSEHRFFSYHNNGIVAYSIGRLYKGMSGSPVLNSNGEVIGIASFISSLDKSIYNEKYSPHKISYFGGIFLINGKQKEYIENLIRLDDNMQSDNKAIYEYLKSKSNFFAAG